MDFGMTLAVDMARKNIPKAIGRPCACRRSSGQSLGWCRKPQDGQGLHQNLSQISIFVVCHFCHFAWLQRSVLAVSGSCSCRVKMRESCNTRLYHNALQCHFEAQGDRRNKSQPQQLRGLTGLAGLQGIHRKSTGLQSWDALDFIKHIGFWRKSKLKAILLGIHIEGSLLMFETGQAADWASLDIHFHPPAVGTERRCHPVPT